MANMTSNQLPGYSSGFIAKRYSSMNKRAIGKLTDSNHISALQHQREPANYDKDIISLYTQTSLFANDFMQLLNKSTPYYIDRATDEFKWKVAVPYQFPTIVAIPDSTASASNLGIDEQPFVVTFDKKEFYRHDVITAHRIYGQKYLVLADPLPNGRAWDYTLKLTSSSPQTDTVDRQWIVEGREFEFLFNVSGEFTQKGTGLGSMGDVMWLYDSLGSGTKIEHTVTGYADIRVASALGGGSVSMQTDERGNPLDIIVYGKMGRNEKGESKPMMLWEPFIEMEMRKRMLSMKVNKMIWAEAGSAWEGQEQIKISMGLIPRMRRFGNLEQYNRGEFSINILRNVFGDLFYRREKVENRHVKLYTNEAGIEVFNTATKDDLLKAGLTLVAGLDNRFIQGSGREMMVNWAFNKFYTFDTGLVEVAHLMELDLPQTNSEFGQNKKSTPIFIVMDVSPNGDQMRSDNIREVRMKAQPSMTWGYVDGTFHHLGFAKSQGMQSANSFPGYTVWMQDRYDIFIEDPTRTAIIEEIPQF